ncbi:MAG: dihydropteroate synthase [Saprospiraceae bacterium]|nr:dihydropteroate synthase [Saprospiraceae bacterium]
MIKVKYLTLFFLNIFLEMLANYFSINCNGKLIDLSSPIVMGILNVTPDSFSDGGQYNTEVSILKKVEQMILEEASIIDIGGQSSRPKAQMIPENVELERILPVIKLIKKEFPDTILSIDTFRASIARIAIEEGISIINDISGGQQDAQMFNVVAQNNVPYIIMHMQGDAQTMQELTYYPNGLVTDILDYFIKRIGELREKNVKDIIIDLGFGFAKTISQNFELLNNLNTFAFLNVPILVGISRKSMIYKTLQITPKEALIGTAALHWEALKQGANILRAHDVKEANQVIKLYRSFANQKI